MASIHKLKLKAAIVKPAPHRLGVFFSKVIVLLGLAFSYVFTLLRGPISLVLILYSKEVPIGVLNHSSRLVGVKGTALLEL